MKAPIVVLMTTRTGSSLTAGILAAHNIWYENPGNGSGQVSVHGNYKTYENKIIKEWFFATYGSRAHFPMDRFCGNEQHVAVELKRLLERVVPQERYWFWKGAVQTAPIWWRLYGNRANYITVRRNFECAFQSYLEKAKLPDKVAEAKAHAALTDRYRLLDYAEKEFDATPVYTDELIMNDFTSIRDAMTIAGYDFNEKLAQAVLEPERWQHERSDTCREQ